MERAWRTELGQFTIVRLSDGCGGQTIPVAVGFGCCRDGFDDYLENVDWICGSLVFLISPLTSPSWRNSYLHGLHEP